MIKRTLLTLLLCAATASAGETRISAATTEVHLLDRVISDQRRPSRFPLGEAGTVIIQHPDTPAERWSQVRWFIRFPLESLTAPVNSATLILWANSHVGATRAPLAVRAWSGGQGATLQPEELGSLILEEAQEIHFPAKPGSIKVDVSELVAKAQSEGLTYAVFEISATSEEMLDGREPGRYFFGGLQNNYNWPEWEPPMLDVED